jgi:hypothetical protein
MVVPFAILAVIGGLALWTFLSHVSEDPEPAR